MFTDDELKFQELGTKYMLLLQWRKQRKFAVVIIYTLLSWVLDILI
jgi:hypothetical protein